MADVHFTITAAPISGAPVYGGKPRGETVSNGGTSSLVMAAGEVCRAKAVSGASYVNLGGATPAAGTGFYLAEGDVIDMIADAGDRPKSANV